MISALEEIGTLRKNKKKKKAILMKYEKEKHESIDSSLILLKIELQETKKIKNRLLRQLEEKEKECEN